MKRFCRAVWNMVARWTKLSLWRIMRVQMWLPTTWRIYIVQEHGIEINTVVFASYAYHCRLIPLHIVGKPPVGKADPIIFEEACQRDFHILSSLDDGRLYLSTDDTYNTYCKPSRSGVTIICYWSCQKVLVHNFIIHHKQLFCAKSPPISLDPASSFVLPPATGRKCHSSAQFT